MNKILGVLQQIALSRSKLFRVQQFCSLEQQRNAMPKQMLTNDCNGAVNCNEYELARQSQHRKRREDINIVIAYTVEDGYHSVEGKKMLSMKMIKIQQQREEKIK